MRRETVKQAFLSSIPVMAGYVVLGTGFGILLRNAGYGVGWAFAMSLLIYAGSLQYVGVSLIAGGASLLTAIIGMLVVFCLKDTVLTRYPHGLPELIAGGIVAGLQAWKRNSLLSILAGTIVYMVLVQAVF